MFFKKMKRRDVISLQLTAMIDVFALIIIFLMKGTVFGVGAVVIPPDLDVPESISHEEVEIAPSVVIDGNNVTSSFIKGMTEVPLVFFRGDMADDPKVKDFKQRIKKYVSSLRPEDRRAGVLLNVVADKKTPYRDVFDVISVYRAAGFESILFIAEGM